MFPRESRRFVTDARDERARSSIQERRLLFISQTCP
jgi:hypothetical protein